MFLTDIDHIISVYFDLNQNEIFEDHFDLMEAYDTTSHEYLRLVSARTIGRKIQALLAGSGQLKNRIEMLLEKRGDDIYRAILAGLKDE